jgi:hypothetical protein
LPWSCVEDHSEVRIDQSFHPALSCEFHYFEWSIFLFVIFTRMTNGVVEVKAVIQARSCALTGLRLVGAGTCGGWSHDRIGRIISRQFLLWFCSVFRLCESTERYRSHHQMKNADTEPDSACGCFCQRFGELGSASASRFQKFSNFPPCGDLKRGIGTILLAKPASVQHGRWFTSVSQVSPAHEKTRRVERRVSRDGALSQFHGCCRCKPRTSLAVGQQTVRGDAWCFRG